MSYGYRACFDCGACVQKSGFHLHECSQERYISHQAMRARSELQHLEDELATWLTTPQGQFQQWMAEHA